MPPNRLPSFLIRSILALIGLIIPWYYLSPYLSAPVVYLAGHTMDWAFPWVSGFERHETVGTLITSLNIWGTQGNRLVLAYLTPEVDYRTFGYGLVLFWALMIASHPTGLWKKMALGTLIIVPSQVFSMCFHWLRKSVLIRGTETHIQADISRWMLEVIAYFDQLGVLVLTPLVPALIWLLLDRDFVNKLWIEMVTVGKGSHTRTTEPDGQ